MMWFGVTIGTLALLLGLGGDWSNWHLARREFASRGSPLVLGPLLLNWCGVTLIFLTLGVHHFVLWIVLAIGLLLIHCVGLRGRII